MKENKNKESGNENQPTQVDGDAKRDRSVQAFIIRELREKPLTGSIALLTFLGTLLLSYFRFLSFIEEKNCFAFFNISSKFLHHSLSESTMTRLVFLILIALLSAFLFCLILCRTEKASEGYRILWRVFLCSYGVFFYIFLILTGVLPGRFSLSVKRILSVVESVLLFLAPTFSYCLANRFFQKRKLVKGKKQKKAKKKWQKKAVDDKTETSDSMPSFSIICAVFFGLFVLITAPPISTEADQFLYRLDHSVISNEGVMYAIVYKTDDYVIGEVVEPKTNQNGETYYEIDTSKQQLFDSFDFQMKFLGKDVNFELKRLDTPSTNPTVPNTTSTSATASETTVPYTSTTNATSNNP